jgi:hypothetical protein
MNGNESSLVPSGNDAQITDSANSNKQRVERSDSAPSVQTTKKTKQHPPTRATAKERKTQRRSSNSEASTATSTATATAASSASHCVYCNATVATAAEFQTHCSSEAHLATVMSDEGNSINQLPSRCLLPHVSCCIDQQVAPGNTAPLREASEPTLTRSAPSTPLKVCI